MQLTVRQVIREERGSAFTEAALICPVLLAFLLGIIQYGFIISAQITLRAASAAAARVAILTPPGDVEDAALQAIQPMLSADQLDTPVTSEDVTIAGGGGTAKRVTLTYNLPLLVSYLVPGSSGGELTLTASTTMR